jgi:hypothetical protein
MKQTFRIHNESSKSTVTAIVQRLPIDKVSVVTIEPETRTVQQNSAQWPILQAFSSQIQWPVNGQMVYMTSENWKDVLTAAYRKECPKMAMDFDMNGVVMLGKKTREFKKEEWPEWMAFLEWAAAEKGVKIPISKREAEAWRLK